MSVIRKSPPPRLELKGIDFFTHYGLSIFLLIPSAVLVVSLLTNHGDYSGPSGMFIVCGISLPASGLWAWWQRRVLRFRRISTSSDASANYRKVVDAVHKARWKIQHHDLDSRIVAAVPGTVTMGDRVEVRFQATDVLVSSICDPKKAWRATGFGFWENVDNIRYIRQAVLDI